MKCPPHRALIFIVMLCAAGEAGRAQGPAAAPEAVPLEQFPQKLTAIDDQIGAKIAEARRVVEEEAIAKRITEPMAQSLRWTLRAVGKGPVNELRSLIETLRVPADNPALTGIVKELEGSLNALHSRRGALLGATVQEVRRRIAEMIRNATAVAEVDALIASLEKVREAQAGATSAYESQSAVTNGIATLRSLRKFIESEMSPDAATIGRAVAEFRNMPRYDPEGGAHEEVQSRAERVVARFAAAAEGAQKALDAGIEARKPQAELAALVEAYETATADVDRARGGYNQNDTRSLSAVYRAVMDAIGVVQAGTDQGGAVQKLREVRGTVQQLGGKRAAVYQTLFAKWEGEIVKAEAKTVHEQQEQIRSRLAATKTASELEAIASDVATFVRKWSMRKDGDHPAWDQLARRLTVLATAWASAAPMLLQQLEGDTNSEGNPFPKELSELRTRVERDVLSRALRAPEINAPPLSEKPLEEAIETFCDSLAEHGEWRRLYSAMEVRAMMRRSDGAARANELLQVLRSFLAAQNFELAEQWTDAAQAYRTVLSSVAERAPVAAAAERLKALTKKHPDALKAPPLGGRPLPGLGQ